MNWDKYTEQLKSDIDQHESIVDPNEIWAAIEPEVDLINAARKKKDRFGAYWFWVGVGLVALVVIVMAFLKEDEEVIVIADQENNQEVNAIGAENNTNSTDTEMGLVTAPINNNVDNEVENKKEQENTIGKVEENTIVNTAEEKETTKKIIRNNTAGPIASTPTPKTFGAKTFDQKNLDYNNVEARSLNTKGSKAETIATNNTTEKTNTQPTETKQNKNRNLITNKTDLAPQVETLAFAANSQTKEPTIALPQIEKNATDFLKKKNARLRNRTDLEFGITAYGGAFLTKQLLSAKTTDDVPLLNLRRATESQLESVNFGLLFSARHPSGWEVSTGVQFTQLNERVRTMFEESDTSFIDGIREIRIRPNGIRDTLRGEVPVFTTFTRENIYYNKYQLIEIPILFGYYRQWETWNGGLQVGMYPNISLSTEGHLLTVDGTPEPIEDQDIFKTSVGVSFSIGLSLQRELFPGVELSLNPNFRFYPKDFTKDAYGLSQSYSLLGMNVGLTYRLGY